VGDFITAELVFHRFPDWDEGSLTSLRSQLVCSETLAEFACEIDLGRYLLLGRGEEQSGGRSRTAMLSDAFEALLGAVYVDQGLEVARGLLLRFLEPHIAAAAEPSSGRDAKTRLQEWTQARHHQAPIYITVEETGPDHAKQFVVEARVLGQVRGSGIGRSKQAAEQAAAKAALAALTNEEADP
jgi:ribonuclease-3